MEIDPLAVNCTYCKAGIGEPCVMRLRGSLVREHGVRFDKARKAAVKEHNRAVRDRAKRKLESEAVRVRHQTIRAALDRDEDSTGFAIARFTLEAGDQAWNPASPPGGSQLTGPGAVTYERRNGRVTARMRT